MPTKRTGSIRSRVPPAVTRTRTPARSRPWLSTSAAAPDDPRGIGEATGTDVAAGEPTRLGVDHVHAAATQRGEVLLDRGVLPHLGVHRGRDEHRRPGREQRCAQQVVRDAHGVLAQQPGGGRSDDDEVGGLAEARVRDRVARRRRGTSARARTRAPRSVERADEPGRVLSEDRADPRPGVDHSSTHLDRLVGGDATRDTEHHSPATERPELLRHDASSRRRRPRCRSPRSRLRRCRP